MRTLGSFAPLALALCLLGCPGQDPQPGGGPPKAPGTSPATPESPTGDAPTPDSEDPPVSSPDATPELSALAKRLRARTPEAIPDRALDGWLTGLAARGDSGWTPEAQASDPLVRTLVESKAATSFCLSEAIDPHRSGASVTWSARPSDGTSPDTLRGTWEAEGYAWTLTETRALIALEAEPLERPAPPLSKASLQRLLNTAVQLKNEDHTWTFALPDGELGQGTHLISNEGAPSEVFAIQSRDDRADVLLVDGAVTLLFFKKIAQRIGFDDEHTWFGDATREALGAQ